MFIDSHCHLNHPINGENTDPGALIAAAIEAGVMGLQTICCRIHEEYETLTALSDAHENLWCSVGTHPHDASNDHEKNYTVQDIVTLSNHPKVIGIGESGLDYFYDYADRADQAASFRKHIQAAQETGLPLIIHARDADRDCMDILFEEIKNFSKPLHGVMHCFSSGEKMAMEALEIGFYISFSGMLTFKKMDWLRDIAAKVPQDRVLIETDAPFLAPAPHRSKVNQPAYVIHTAQTLAHIYNLTHAEVGDLTTSNFFTLFSKAKSTLVEPQT
jgi:TatD DNase family protein